MAHRLMRTALLCAAIAVAGCARGPSGEDGGEAGARRTAAEHRAANEAAGAAGTLMPVDEASRNPEFATFRDALAVAVEHRDTAAVMAVIDPGIKWSFGADHGIDAFRAHWLGADAPENLWEELGEVLELGGSFASDSQFVAPYTFSKWQGAMDAYSHVVVTAADAPVRAAPLEDAAVLATVGHAIFRLDSNHGLADALEGWAVVDRGAGTPGFVARRFTRSPLDYRAFFERKSGEWRMTLFLAGD